MYSIIITLNKISHILENLMIKIDGITFNCIDFNNTVLLNKLIHNLYPGYIRFRIISHIDYFNKKG